MDPITIALVIAAILAAELLRPKKRVEQARPPGLGDFQFPTAEEGRPVSLLWGRCKMEAPNVVWYGDLRSDPVLEKVKTGLFSSTRILKAYEYHLGMQLAICRGTIDGVRRQWIGDQLVYDGGLATSSYDIDLPNLLGGDEGQGGMQATVTIYRGGQTASDDYLENFQDSGAGTDRTPHYGGNAYLVARELGHTGGQLGGAYLGNNTSIQPWKFEVERYPAIFSGQSAGQNKVGVDCNPANVFYEYITNTEWGWGDASSLVDLVNFKAAADTFITEGNGFSMVLDSSRDVDDMIKELERQVGGVLDQDPITGKWQIRLARADYNINTVYQVTAANCLEVRDFQRSSWSDTTNQVSVRFNKRDDQYKESFAMAHDVANAQIQGGGTVATANAVVAEVNYPGVKDSDLAAQLAWRDLRSLSYPLARATFVLDRQAYTVRPGDVLAWTDALFGFTKMPMRVLKVDYGTLQSNQIVATCVEDVFYFINPSFGAPPASGWAVPEIELVAYPSAQQMAMEAPRAIVERDPSFGGNMELSRILTAARRQGGETSFTINQRHSSGTPAGSYTEAGEVVQFVRIGSLSSSLAVGTAVPTTTITIDTSPADPDTQADILAAFDAGTTLEDLGQELSNLILVGTEFMLASGAAATGSDVNLTNVYRGVLDTVQQAHSAGDDVWLVFKGAGLSSVSFVNTDNVDVQLRAKSPQEIFSGSPTTIALTMAKRTLRPYPVAGPLFDAGSTLYGTPNLEASGSGLNGLRTSVSWLRRDYRVGDEVHALLCDGSTVTTTTEHQLEVRADPTGANTLVGSASAYAYGTTALFVTLADVVTAAAIGTSLRFIVRTRHDIGAEVDLGARYDMTYDVIPTAATYSGKFYLGGGITAGSNSNTYTAVATGTFTLEIGALQATAAIQVSLNGGAYSTVIAAGLTSGTFAVTSGDTIRVKRTVSEAPNPNFVRLKNPSAAVVAYGTFKT